jgi:hypothetical protein
MSSIFRGIISLSLYLWYVFHEKIVEAWVPKESFQRLFREFVAYCSHRVFFMSISIEFVGCFHSLLLYLNAVLIL